MNPARIMIAGTGSGTGKTTVSLGLMAALARRGLAVHPFKVGPDYIDPGLHQAACGRISHNLDAWLMPEAALIDLFARRAPAPGRGLALVEGVMGLFDGLGGGAYASSAHVAGLLRLPVLLLIDAVAASLSVAATTAGFAAFKPGIAAGGPDLSGLRVAGVILNRVSGARHAASLRRAVEEHSGLPCLGCLPKNAAPPMPERHLGLLPAAEQPQLAQSLDQLAHCVERHIDIPLLLRIARDAPPLFVPAPGAPFMGAALTGRGTAAPGVRPPRTGPAIAPSSLIGQGAASFSPVPTAAALPGPDRPKRPEDPPPFAGLRIGLARDAAFSFYYQDGLDLLRELGAELLPFSPLADARLPENLHGLLLGGGFPEVFAAGLEANTAMRAALAHALQGGLPAYAECGGMLYLCRSLAGREGSAARDMTAFFPQGARMTNRLQPFGYVTLRLERDCLLGLAGQKLRAHEFHYSRLERAEPAMDGRTPDGSPADGATGGAKSGAAKKDVNGVAKGAPEKDACETGLITAVKADGRSWRGGLSRAGTVAWYPHLHFRGCPEAARTFLSACGAFRKKSSGSRA